MATPLPILWIYLGYLSMVFAGPRLMKPYQAFSLRPIIIAYNFALVLLSLYMFEEVRAQRTQRAHEDTK